MIVLHHICVHGNFGHGYNIRDFNPNMFLPQFLSIYGKVGVFLFAMVTGFFFAKSNSNLKRLKSLLFLVLFYLTIGFLVSIRAKYKLGVLNISELKQTILSSFYPFTGYWFMNSYIILYILTPYINKIFDNLEKKEFKKLLFILVFILSFSGIVTNDYDPLGGFGNLILAYFLGAYLNVYPVKIPNRFLFLILFLSISMIGLLIGTVDKLPITDFVRSIIGTPISFARDNNIFVVAVSVSIFLLMQKVKITNLWIQKIVFLVAGSTLGVYLLHDNKIIRSRITDHLAMFLQNPSSVAIVIKIIFLALFVFCVSVCFELCRQCLLKFIFKFLNNYRDKGDRS